MSLQNCPDLSLLCIMHSDMAWGFGSTIGAIFYGGSLVLGISCVSLLSSTETKATVHRRVLRAYVIALLIGNTILVIACFLWYYLPSTFIPNNIKKIQEATPVLTFLGCLVPVIIAGLVDGLLAWRCYMVQRALETRRTRWGNIFWVFPLCLWITTTTTGFTGAVTLMVGTPDLKPLSYTLKAIALGSNTLLNFFATFFIIIRLLIHKRLVNRYLARVTTAKSHSASTPTVEIANTRHLRFVGILLQSAAVNIPITVAAAIGVGADQFFGTVAVFVAVTCQSFASVLIIYQVAIGRAVGGRRESIGEA